MGVSVVLQGRQCAIHAAPHIRACTGGQCARQHHTNAERLLALRAGPPKAAPGGVEEGGGAVPARAHSSAFARLSLRLQSSGALQSAGLRWSMLKGLSVAEVSRASHLAHTQLSARRSVGSLQVKDLFG